MAHRADPPLGVDFFVLLTADLEDVDGVICLAGHTGLLAGA